MWATVLAPATHRLASPSAGHAENWGEDDCPGLPGFENFQKAAKRGNIVPLYERLFSDRITPVLAYRSLVPSGDHTSPSFLLESVNNGSQQAGTLCTSVLCAAWECAQLILLRVSTTCRRARPACMHLPPGLPLS